MKNPCNTMKRLFMAGLTAMIFLLATPAVSADVFFPTPYSMGPSLGQYPVIGEPVIGSGSFVNPGVIVPANIPLAPDVAMPGYPAGTLYPVIINPAISGYGTTMQTLGGYYEGRGTRSGRFGSTGGFMCSL